MGLHEVERAGQKHFDVLIIGAGAVGNAIAREISKNSQVTVAVLEKEPDTAFGISGRNSGVLHAGFNNKPGSFMARLCVLGSEGFEEEAKKLRVPFKRTGKLVIARFEEDRNQLLRLKEQGEASGVKDLRVVEKEELERLAGYPAGIAALWSGMTGIFDPFRYTVALAEAAFAQGTKFYFGRKVVEVEQGFFITAKNLASGCMERYSSRVLINCAGLSAGEICKMAGGGTYIIHPCRGEYHVLDRKDSALPEIPIYPIPNEKEGGLGVHLTPTIDGNLMIGPSAEYLPEGWDSEDYSTTLNVMDRLKTEGVHLLPNLEHAACIRSFSGIRPKLVSEKEGGYADFVIEESNKVPGMIQLLGIESPGLTASIPIGRAVAKMAGEILERLPSVSESEQHKQISPKPPAVPRNAQMEKGDLKMLCRCEGITEEAVLDAYDRICSIGAIPTVKGLKNRTRITMGYCQGSFCTINLLNVLTQKRGLDPFELLWSDFGSYLLEGSVRK